MIGVIHRVADLEELLFRRMETIGPDVVTLEFSGHGLAFRQARGEEIARRIHGVVDELLAEGYSIDGRALDALLAYVALPSEFTAASRFAQVRGIPLYLVDMDGYSRSHLSCMDELLARENLAKLLCGPPPERERLESAAARLFFEKGVSLFSYTEEMDARDSHMRDRIGELMESHKPARFLHICGWQHLPDPHGLYAPFNPEKAFIYDKALRI
jgi:hypothetical protein